MTNIDIDHIELLRKLNSSDFLQIAKILIFAWLLAWMARWIIRRVAESVPSKLRLPILRFIPLARLIIFASAAIMLVPIVVEPTLQNVIALLASVSLLIAFVLKDYASSLVAGLVTILENVYQPGDWIDVDGTYGEVKLISLRAVHIVTPDDNEVIIPHYRFWTKKVSNSTSGNKSLMCVANFYLHPDHDGQVVLKCLKEIAEISTFREPDSKISVTAQEKPWGSHYKLKAYVHDGREQFIFITDLTIRAKESLRAINIRFAQAEPAVNLEK